MVTIHNLKTMKPTQPYDIIVDRTSVLGNPFRMSSESERQAVCEKYKTYFYQRLKNSSPAFRNALRELYKIHKEFGQLRLFCWCYPKQCHAETIKEFLEQYI